MNVLFIIGFSLLLLGMGFGVVADIFYQSPIQRYLEKVGKKPAHLLAIGGGLDNYFSAKDIAKKSGHNPIFLQRYAQIPRAAFVLLAGGAILMFSWLLSLI